MKKLSIIILTCGLFLTQAIRSQVTMSGELRPRTEYAHGLKSLASPNQDAALFTTQRTRINLGYRDDFFTTSVVLQDVRLWGSQAQLVQNENYAVSVHEAWGELNLCPDFSIKAGRQELSYDNHRILGNVGWAQQARSHDVALLKYSGLFNAHLGLAYHQDGILTKSYYTGPDAYKAMQFLWLNKKFDVLTTSLLFLNNGVPVNTTNLAGSIIEQNINYTQTIGTYNQLNAGVLTLEGSFYYQMGKLVSGREVSAIQFMVGGSLSLGEMLSVNAGFEHLSGTDNGASGKSHSFNPLYGTNHKFNGFMDYFYVGNHIGNVGLNDLYAGAKAKMEKLTAMADLHFFSAAAEINPNADAFLGAEIDLTMNYAVSKSASVAVGYSQMVGTHAMEHLKGGSKDEFSNWAYVMLTFTPQFIK